MRWQKDDALLLLVAVTQLAYGFWLGVMWETRQLNRWYEQWQDRRRRRQERRIKQSEREAAS